MQQATSNCSRDLSEQDRASVMKPQAVICRKSNYSSTRQGIIEDDMTYAEEKEMLMEVMDEIYETFVISMWLAGELEAKDFWENKDKYFEHAWITAPKKWIDPQKEANANKIALNTGQKTFKQIAAEQGRDWKEQIDEMAEVLNTQRIRVST